jgi:hypothetical protein
MDGFREIELNDLDFGNLKLLLPVPRTDNPWGVLAPLRETPWGREIPIVSGKAMSHALHGLVKPLWEQLGRPPQAIIRRLGGDQYCELIQKGNCLMASKDCYLGSGKLPATYVPPHFPQVLGILAATIARAWDEGRYVIVVEGDEFSF